MALNEAHPPVVDVTSGIRGWFAVLLTWETFEGMEEGGMYTPWQTGIGSYKDRAGAVVEAREWAAAEGVKCVAGLPG